MRSSVWYLLAACVLATAGCSLHRQPVSISQSGGEVANRWNADLATPPALTGALQVKGSAWMQPSGTNSTRVHIAISNAAPGGVHPWAVYRGHCGGANSEVVGSASAYPPLTVSDDGTAAAAATLPLAVSDSGSYSVSVQASAQNTSTVIACGNLAPPLK